MVVAGAVLLALSAGLAAAGGYAFLYEARGIGGVACAFAAGSLLSSSVLIIRGSVEHQYWKKKKYLTVHQKLSPFLRPRSGGAMVGIRGVF
jgi:hypothetical protein